MIQINPLKSYIDGGVRAALTTPPSASLVFDLPGKAIWVKGVKLKGTDHTYTFSHDNYITLTNTPDSNESEDIKIGVNTSALKSAIDTTYGVVSTTANGLAPKFTSGNKQAAAAATTYYFLGWAGSTLKWYQAPFRNIRINSETTDCLGVNNTDPLIISSGNGISVTWDSTNKKIIITNTKPDVNHNTDTKVAQSVTTQNKNYAIILKGNDSDEGSITTVNFSTYLKFNPSTKKLTINGSKVITATDTFVGATTSADGSVGLVTKPLIANRLQFLRGDGTWATPIDTWRPVKVEGTEKLGSNALDLSAGNGISIIYNSDTKKIVITNTKPDVNHNTHYTTMLYIGENNDTKANKNVANPYLKLFDDNTRRATFQIKAGNGIAVASDANGNITITNSAPDVNHNTDITVKQTPKTDNVNRPLMMINGSTSVGEQINTSMFSTSIYANASTKMITANGFIKAGSSNSYVLLGSGGHKALSDFSMSGHNHDGRYLRWNGSAADISAMDWGTLTAANGYTILSHAASSDGGDVGFTNKGGKIFMQLDGYYYQNEGRCRVLDTSDFTAFSNIGNQTTRITIGGITKDLKIDADTLDNRHATYFWNYKTPSKSSGDLDVNEVLGDTIAAWAYGFAESTNVIHGPIGDKVSDARAYYTLGGVYCPLQLSWYYNNSASLYARTYYNGKWYSWNKIAFVNNIPTVTNYYWANLSVQSSASNTTVPSFGAIRLNGVSSAGTNYITGAAGRIFFGGNFHIDSLESNKTYINYYTANDVYLCSGSSQGKVGIGTNSPAYKLDVFGQIRAQFASTNGAPGILLTQSSNTNWAYGVEVLNNNLTEGNRIGGFVQGKNHATNNWIGTAFEYKGNNSSENRIHWHFYGNGDKMTLTGQGYLKTGRLWLNYRSNNDFSYSWTNAALTVPTIEIQNYTGTTESMYPTLTLHHYGYGGPRLGSRQGILTIYGGNTDARTLGERNSHFSSLKMYPNEFDGLYVNNIKVLLAYRRFNPNIQSSDAGQIPPAVLECMQGYALHSDPEFHNGLNGIAVYNNNGNGTVTISRVADSTSGNSSGYVMQVNSGSGASPRCGGWYFGDVTARGRQYTCIFRAKIPIGSNVFWESNSFGSGGSMSWITSTAGTGKWEWYAVQVYCGTSSFSSTNFFDLDTASTWYVSFANTYINSWASWNGLKVSQTWVRSNSPWDAAVHSTPGRSDSDAGSSWLFVDDAGGYSNVWGIKHNQPQNYIEYYGAGARRGFVNLNSGGGFQGNHIVSEGRSYIQSDWLQINDSSGIYWPNANNASHFFPNSYTTYGNFVILGSRGGYTGFQFGSSTAYMTIMDSGTHKGIYSQGWGEWILYFNQDSKRLGLRTSSLTGYSVTCQGDFYCRSGWLRTEGVTGWYNESYGGGIYMEDSTYVRTYGSKSFYVSNTGNHAIYTAGSFASAKLGGFLSVYSNGSWYYDCLYNHNNGNLSFDAPGGSLYISYFRGNTYFAGGSYYINRSGYTYFAHYYETSDIRKKNILNSLNITSKQLSELPLFNFTWKDKPEDGLQSGTSAQAVQTVLPTLVSGTDILHLDYGVLGTIAGITACKELVTQKSELQQLKEKVKQLEDKLRKYENTL